MLVKCRNVFCSFWPRGNAFRNQLDEQDDGLCSQTISNYSKNDEFLIVCASLRSLCTITNLPYVITQAYKSIWILEDTWHEYISHETFWNFIVTIISIELETNLRINIEVTRYLFASMRYTENAVVFDHWVIVYSRIIYSNTIKSIYGIRSICDSSGLNHVISTLCFVPKFRHIPIHFLGPDLKTSNRLKKIEIQRIRDPSFIVKVSNLKYTAFIKSKISLKYEVGLKYTATLELQFWLEFLSAIVYWGR